MMLPVCRCAWCIVHEEKWQCLHVHDNTPSIRQSHNNTPLLLLLLLLLLLPLSNRIFSRLQP